jgi:hypothetical protein
VATSTPTSTATPAGQSSNGALRFVNGGFEDELDGWLKFGGELQAVESPRRAGSGAARFSSNTASTKWAYQVVEVDGGRAYAFDGYAQVGAGVEAAYLRISWYESEDGSGTAISTDDSTASLTTSTSDFVYLTTGPCTAPDGARSARLRVMLAPAGDASASLYLDDFSFGLATTAAVPTLTPTPAPLPTQAQPSSQPQATALPSSTAQLALPATATLAPTLRLSTPTPPRSTPSVATATRVAEVAAAVVQATRPPSAPDAPPRRQPAPTREPRGLLEGVPLLELGGGMLAGVILVRVLRLVSRRRSA